MTYEYEVTQEDFDTKAEIEETVCVNATAVVGPDPEEATDTATVTAAEAAAGLTVALTADPAEGVTVGDTVTFTATVENTGTVSVKDGTLVSALADLSGETFSLAPDETAEVTYTYEVTQDDFDSSDGFEETVCVNATAVVGPDPEEATAAASVPLAGAAAALSVTLEADPAEDVEVGDTVTFTATVENTGNVSVMDGTLASALADLSDETFSLAPGQRATVTYEYEVTQEDFDTKAEIEETVCVTDDGRRVH